MTMGIGKAISGIVIILGVSISLGYTFLPWKLNLPFSIRTGFSIIILSFITTILGFGHHFKPDVIYLSYVFLFVISILIIYIKRGIKFFHLPKIITPPIFFNLIGLTFLIYFTLILLNTLTPPISRDALNYHLFLPKIWLSRGAIITIPENIYSFFPAYWECFLSSAMVIGNDITPKLLHFLYLIFLCFLLTHFLKEFSANKWANILCLIFIATPVVNRIAAWAYLDLVFSFYTLGALFLLIKYTQEDKKIYFWLSALFAGYSVGMKYLGLTWLICLLPFFIYQNKNWKTLTAEYIKYISVAIIVGSPFYIRNWIHTGNPFFPFLSSIFHNHLLPQDKYQLLMLYFNSYGRGKSFLDLILLPFRLLFQAEFKSPQGFDGKINILYLLGLALFIKHKRDKSPRYLFLIFLSYILFWFYLSQQMRFLIPGLFILLVIYGLYFPDNWKKHLYYLVPLCCLFYLKYPLADFLKYKPYRYITKTENRRQFLNRNLRIFPLLDYINKRLTPSSKIMLLDMGAIGYYLDIPIYQEAIFEDFTFKAKLAELNHLQAFLKHNGITHILMDIDFINKYFIPRLEKKETTNFKLFLRNDLELIAKYYNWYLFKLNF